ncbi:MAG: YfiR family protein [Bacteroidia bacterium]
MQNTIAINAVRKLRVPGFVVVLCMLMFPFQVKAQETNYRSYALLLYNFAKNTTYPSSAKTTYTFGVYGASPVLQELQKLAKLKKVHNLTIVVKQVNTPQEAAQCDQIFLPVNKSNQIKAITEATKGKPVLLVAERENYYLKGAAISFVIDDDDILRFDINTKILKQQGLDVTPNLLQVANDVD